MSKFAWATDIHLDHLANDGEIISFGQDLIKDDPTGIFLTGDLSTAKTVVYHLSALEKVVQRPVYFVLGNHDFYGGSIETTRKTMFELTNVSQYLKYMPASPYVPLSNNTAVIGHDGWYDALYGDWQQSRFMMTDWGAIQEFIPFSGGMKSLQTGRMIDRAGMVAFCRKLAQEGAAHIRDSIKSASRYHKNLIILTHFPPFEEAHVYQGTRGGVLATPWYTSKIMGEMLRDAARSYPNINFTVLAGHTHGKVSAKIERNLDVHVGHADYGSPQLGNLIEVL